MPVRCVCRTSALRGRRSRWGWHDHDDRRESRGLAPQLRIRIPGGSSPRPVLDRDARRKRHGFVAKTPDLEHMGRRLPEDFVAALFQNRPVIRHQFGVRCGGPKDVVALRSPGIVGRKELGCRIDRKPERRFSGCPGIGRRCSRRRRCLHRRWRRCRCRCGAGGRRLRPRRGILGWLR